MRVLDRAADLWIQARANGLPREDVDLIIAATSLIHDFTLVTANVKNFDWIAGLKIEELARACAVGNRHGGGRSRIGWFAV